jgi:hypothetical protein
MNLFDLTGGHYRVHRTVTYPDFPKSRIVFETNVRAVKEREWSTSIRIDGTYDGPTDVIAVRDYQIVWTTDGKKLFEEGSAKLLLASGGTVQSRWTSEIAPTQPNFGKFPRDGELVRVAYSNFEIRDKTMSYVWEGTVEARKK